jgi:hypothetical protein
VTRDEARQVLTQVLASTVESERSLRNSRKVVESIRIPKGDLLHAPLMRRLTEAERAVQRVRHQLEQLAYGGDPYMTGLPEGEERLARQRETLKKGVY